ncbi:MAG: hypothetical protein GKR95_12835 [Gammaproteobacteria bacterium]|nr:hypothetical protein [Gammaproteobacteria bacterium]NKB62957.1 hypothetical protein [Gammaproteobacteria bacterium]
MKLAAMLSAALVLTGCMTSHSIKSETNEIPAPSDDSAVVVFMRSSFIMGGVSMNLFEKSDGELSFVGTMADKSKIAHRTKPGKKVFMTHIQDVDFMPAEVEANKTYYVIIRPIWPSRFAPTPLKTDGTTKFNTDDDRFLKWKDGTQRYELAESADAWFSENKAAYEAIYDAGWEEFQSLSPEKQAERVLTPSDGI